MSAQINEQAGRDAGAGMQAHPPTTRMDTGSDGGAVAGVDRRPLPKTGIKAAELAALLNDLERVGASDRAGEVPSLCRWAKTVIEGLLSGLDVEQLS